jgi:hypothetical protein
LSTAFSEGKQEVKAEWPKVSGDSNKFCAWYLGIMTQTLLPPWQELYDPIKHDVVNTTQNVTLNGKLYSKFILALEGSAYKNFVSRKHLRANGISLLVELVQTYKPRNVPELIAAKTVEFWGQMKRQPKESIDAYYDRFQELLADLEDAEEPIAPKAAIRHFFLRSAHNLKAFRITTELTIFLQSRKIPIGLTFLLFAEITTILSSLIFHLAVLFQINMIRILTMKSIKRKSKYGS